MATQQDPHGFAEHRVSRSIIQRQRVARTTGVGRNADVTGWHVREIAEQPQWLHLRKARFSPARDLEVGRTFIAAGNTGFRQHVQSAQHQVGTELDTQPLVIDGVEVDFGVLQCQAGRSHAKLDLAAHRLDVLALIFEIDLARQFIGELCDRTADAVGSRDAWKQIAVADARPPLGQALPKLVDPNPDGTQHTDTSNHDLSSCLFRLVHFHSNCGNRC